MAGIKTIELEIAGVKDLALVATDSQKVSFRAVRVASKHVRVRGLV